MRDAQQEAVELRLRQRERALQLDRVLGGQHQEWVRQRPGLALGADLALLHRLQQGRLRPWRGSVDLVHQQHVGEDRARDEAELPLVQDARAGDIGRAAGPACPGRARRSGPVRARTPAPAASCRRRARPPPGRDRPPAARWPAIAAAARAPTTAAETACCTDARNWAPRWSCRAAVSVTAEIRSARRARFIPRSAGCAAPPHARPR